MIKMMKKVIVILCVFIQCGLYSQHSLDIAASDMIIYGTSSMHDWKVEVDLNKVTLKKIDFKNSRLNGITIGVPVAALMAPKKLMQKKLLKVLKATKHPFLSIQINDCTVKQDTLFSDKGLFTIAGKQQVLPFKTEYSTQKEGYLMLSGTQSIDMTHFDMKPPSAMFGLMNVGNEVLVKFKLLVSLENKSERKIK